MDPNEISAEGMGGIGVGRGGGWGMGGTNVVRGVKDCFIHRDI